MVLHAFIKVCSEFLELDQRNYIWLDGTQPISEFSWAFMRNCMKKMNLHVLKHWAIKKLILRKLNTVTTWFSALSIESKHYLNYKVLNAGSRMRFPQYRTSKEETIRIYIIFIYFNSKTVNLCWHSSTTFKIIKSSY